MKIYTKTGDEGESSLLFGTRVSKNDLHLEAFGTVDEANSHIGVLRSMLEDQNQVDEQLAAAQSNLFTIGSIMAAEKDRDNLQQLDKSHISDLEKHIDEMDNELPELKNFILPGGSSLAAQAHVCRTVCRRAERVAAMLHQNDPLHPETLQYLNRLSDYFFVLARWINQVEGITDVVWNPKK